MKAKFLASLLGLTVLALFSGCSSVIKLAPYPDSKPWGDEVKLLGTVMADSGRWPLALQSTPPEYTFFSALRTRAAMTYRVPDDEIVLRDVTVRIKSEVVGTIRSWHASAIAGRRITKPEPSKSAAESPKSAADSLLELKRLLDAGAITQAEYDAKKKAILDKF